MPIFYPDELEQTVAAMLQGASVPATEAAIVAKHLVEANLAGHDSHGVLRVPQYVNGVKSGKVKPANHAKLISENGCTAVMDGQMGFGQVIAKEAMELAMNKAGQSGVAAVSFCNSYHTGRIASYTIMAARKGFAAIAMVNAGGGGQSVAPFGGLSRRLATNPVSIASPSADGHPLVLDIATSVAPEGKLRDYWLKQKPLPSGWIIDANGQPSTDANDFYASPGGALLPLGGPAGYKGFGLGFMVDILAGALSGAGCCRPGVSDPKDGLLFIVLDVQRFIPLEIFYNHVQQLIAHVKSTPVAPGFREVFVPGEVERLEETRRRKDGISVDEHIWEEIEKTAQDLGVSIHRLNGTSSSLMREAVAVPAPARP